VSKTIGDGMFSSLLRLCACELYQIPNLFDLNPLVGAKECRCFSPSCVYVVAQDAKVFVGCESHSAELK
jgi:hypothetical protein